MKTVTQIQMVISRSN